MNDESLNFLFIEDSKDDLALILRELKKNNFNFTCKSVENAEQMTACLDNERWDVIIADYVLPQFSGLKALELVKAKSLDIPFIIISGAIGEDLAVDAMRAGAHDYILKDRPIRLSAAIERELKEAKLRQHKKIVEAQLVHNAFYDALTGLPNRSLLLDRLHQSLSRSKRHENYIFAVISINIDRFNLINESLGHEFGDKLLVHFAMRVESCIRPGDTLSHLGGDDFVILLDDIPDVHEATRVMERVKSDLKNPFHLKDNEIFISVSAGITSNITEYERPEDLLRDAGAAIHKAKYLGKSRFDFFDKKMHASVLNQLKLETDLRKALQKNECLVYYQPILSLADFTITSFEALMRWNHNGRIIPPNDFIPSAEETGVIVGMERWLILDACKQLSSWHKKFPKYENLSISVNLSSKQFNQSDLVEFIKHVLSSTQLSPSNLILEITENVIMKHLGLGLTLLNKLKELGIKLYIDDFGTGYSSLSHLLQFPVDVLKIDRSFINKLNHSRKNLEIVQTVLTLSENLGMDIIAEGIETKEQLNQLKTMKCKLGQGFLFATPLPKDDAEALLKSAIPFNFAH